MFGLGTLINTGAIIVAGIIGSLFGSRLKPRFQETLVTACGVSVLFIGISGALEGMIKVTSGQVSSARSMFVTICLVVGAFIGELFDFEGIFERFGEWLKIKSGNAKDKNFVNAFLTASFTVCIGAMAIVGALEDGMFGDYTLLAVKATLDFIIVTVMTCSMGKGAAFSAIPVFVLQGAVTALAGVVKPFMTQSALSCLSFVGSILIFCVGLNLVWGKKVKVANFLPAIILAIALSFVPESVSWLY